ncbi:MAG: hypothetical protein LBV04_03945 [Deferribacteraceae bacterium]|jgi:hypothetical protein|nr:hypothetical protein [Deferribacteraceae bacterium]
MIRVVFSAILCFHLFASPFIDVALAQNRGTVIDPTSKGSLSDVINIAAPSAYDGAVVTIYMQSLPQLRLLINY